MYFEYKNFQKKIYKFICILYTNYFSSDQQKLDSTDHFKTKKKNIYFLYKNFQKKNREVYMYFIYKLFFFRSKKKRWREEKGAEEEVRRRSGKKK